MLRIAGFALAAALTQAAGTTDAATAASASAAPAADGVRVEVAGRGRDVVRLVDPATRALVASDRLPGEPIGDSLVSSDGAVVAVRHGAADGGDGLAVYAIVRAVDPATGAPVARVARALAYRPRDGRLGVVLRTVPDGTVVEVESGRHPPYWRKVFLHRRDNGLWLEWPRALSPNDPTAGLPAAVGRAATADPYVAWLRPMAPAAD